MAKQMSAEYWASGSDTETSTEERVKASARVRAMLGRKPNLKGVPAQYQAIYLSVYASFSAV